MPCDCQSLSSVFLKCENFIVPIFVKQRRQSSTVCIHLLHATQYAKNSGANKCKIKLVIWVGTWNCLTNQAHGVQGTALQFRFQSHVALKYAEMVCCQFFAQLNERFIWAWIGFCQARSTSMRHSQPMNSVLLQFWLTENSAPTRTEKKIKIISNYLMGILFLFFTLWKRRKEMWQHVKLSNPRECQSKTQRPTQLSGCTLCISDLKSWWVPSTARLYQSVPFFPLEPYGQIWITYFFKFDFCFQQKSVFGHQEMHQQIIKNHHFLLHHVTSIFSTSQPADRWAVRDVRIPGLGLWRPWPPRPEPSLAKQINGTITINNMLYENQYFDIMMLITNLYYVSFDLTHQCLLINYSYFFEINIWISIKSDVQCPKNSQLPSLYPSWWSPFEAPVPGWIQTPWWRFNKKLSEVWRN